MDKQQIIEQLEEIMPEHEEYEIVSRLGRNKDFLEYHIYGLVDTAKL